MLSGLHILVRIVGFSLGNINFKLKFYFTLEIGPRFHFLFKCINSFSFHESVFFQM